MNIYTKRRIEKFVSEWEIRFQRECPEYLETWGKMKEKREKFVDEAKLNSKQEAILKMYEMTGLVKSYLQNDYNVKTKEKQEEHAKAVIAIKKQGRIIYDRYPRLIEKYVNTRYEENYNKENNKR